MRAESPGQALVGIGLRDIVAIAMRDAVLVADMTDGQRVKEAVALLKAAGAAAGDRLPALPPALGLVRDAVRSATASRSSGSWCTRAAGSACRATCTAPSTGWWSQGTARVTVGDEVRLLTENQSAYIPLGAVHRLENPGKLDLHLIEVQSGPYLGEDDIIRYEDVYARA